MCPSLKKGGKEKKTPGLVWGRKMLFVARSEGSRALAVPPLISHSVARPWENRRPAEIEAHAHVSGIRYHFGAELYINLLASHFCDSEGERLNSRKEKLNTSPPNPCLTLSSSEPNHTRIHRIPPRATAGGLKLNPSHQMPAVSSLSSSRNVMSCKRLLWQVPMGVTALITFSGEGKVFLA